MQGLIDWLKGKKTYIIAVGGIITAIGAYLNGSISVTDLVFAIFSATGVSALRGGIAKATPLITIAALSLSMLGLTSCSSLTGFLGGTATTDEVTSLTAVAVSNALAFGVKDSAQRATVAKEMVSISDIYVTYSNGSVPTPEQFQALINKYIPAGDSKAITVSDITALYTLRYSSFKDYKLPDQIAYLTAFLNGVKNGATPFATTQGFWPFTPVHPKLPDRPLPRPWARTADRLSPA